MPTGWTNSRTFTLSATDATSGVASLEYKIGNGGPVTTVASGTERHAPRSTARTRSATAPSTSPASPRAGRSTPTRSTPSCPSTRAPRRRPRGSASLSLPLTGTDLGGSTFDHGEWRVNGGDVQTGATAIVETEGTQTLETRRSSTRPATSRPGARRPSGSTAPSPSTRRRSPARRGARPTTRRPSPAPTRPPVRACRGSSTSSTAAPSLTTPAVSITERGHPHARDARRSTSRATSRTGAPTRSASTRPLRRCRSTAARRPGARRAAVCSVSAYGGDSGLPTLTAALGSGAAAAVAGGATPWTPTAPRPSASAPSTAPATRRRRAPPSRSTPPRPPRPSSARRGAGRPTSAPPPAPTRCPAWRR